MSRRTQTVAAAVKLGVFTLASVLVTGLLVVLMSNVGAGNTTTYKAVFSNASMLQEGDDVRVAGVAVGHVTSVEHYHRSRALVTFAVEKDVPLTQASRAEIRFQNLIGGRYLALERGQEKPSTPPLEPGATIPIEQTSPALDLTVLFNGFKPLFDALDPEQVNKLAMNLIEVLQGEGGTIRSLMQHVASLTNTLADRDKLIGQVITNLTETLNTVDQNHEQLSKLIVELRKWMSQLARNRSTIGASLENIAQLTKVVAGFVKDARPLLKEDIAQLRELARRLSKPRNRKILVEVLNRLPETMTDQTRLGTYGSWYNYYLCGFSGRIQLPLISDIPGLRKLQKLLSSFAFRSTVARCD